MPLLASGKKKDRIKKNIMSILIDPQAPNSQIAKAPNSQITKAPNSQAPSAQIINSPNTQITKASSSQIVGVAC